jgi:ribosomal protein S18 acetylase RimI-like enzyme
MDDVIVRRALINDTANLVEYGAKSFTDTFGHLYPKNDLQSYLIESYNVEKFTSFIENNEKYLCCIAISDNKIVGYILVSKGVDLPHEDITDDCFEVMKLYISEEQFGKGVAQQLMDQGMKWYESHDNHNDFYLSVYSDNIRAQKFYEKYGFQFAKEYGYVVGNSIDREFIFRRKKVTQR